jgi:hypothetical protein
MFVSLQLMYGTKIVLSISVNFPAVGLVVHVA